ncbi:MAG TPA: hypothetical protein VHV83_03945 [Armatimonadota bacterium]|nr:hypothetical protein [Armatimonadota bacterium]
MSRRIITSLLALGLIGAPVLNSIAHADGVDSAKQPIATQASIQALLDKNRINDAEAGYLEWVNSWQEENIDMLYTVESQLLLKQYAGGNKDAFVALAQAGDQDALDAVRKMIKNQNTAGLSATQFAAAIRSLGKYGTDSDTGTLALALSQKDALIVDTAIEAMGMLGNKDALPYFYIVAADANLNRSITIAQAMMAMGAASDLEFRYLSQMKSPFEGMPERAAILLTESGNSSAWGKVKQMLGSKSSAYYPQALRVLGNQNSDEARGYIRTALKGNEQEQLAALQSISALPQDEIDATLASMVNDGSATLNVRIAAMNQLANRTSDASGAALRSALTNESYPSDLRAAALKGIQQRGLVTDDGLRGTIRLLMTSSDAKIATAARSAMLGYAITMKAATPVQSAPAVTQE